MMRREANARERRIEREFAVRPVRVGGSADDCRLKLDGRARPIMRTVPLACGSAGGAWPLRVEFGFLRCDRGRVEGVVKNPVVFTTPSGGNYGVNGAANVLGYPPIKAILRSGPSALVRRGLEWLGRQGSALCDRSGV
jgi:hypothetical protein